MLYIVPTPIGNMEDITLRALRTLREVSVIYAEDTRTSRRILDAHDIKTPMRSFHAHNEHKIVERIADELASGADFALISDAGTPAISDPGFLLVRAARARGVAVTCLPGATAFVPALVASGLPASSFHFEGFLPHKKGRQTRLKYLAELSQTVILYESPHRLLRCLKELEEHCGGERQACVAREISKLHEEIKTDTLAALQLYFTEKGVKGEIVVVLDGKTE